jgi:hypothetical protein
MKHWLNWRKKKPRATSLSLLIPLSKQPNPSRRRNPKLLSREMLLRDSAELAQMQPRLMKKELLLPRVSH